MHDVRNPTGLTILQKVQGYLAAIGIKSRLVTVDASAVLFAGWTDTKPDTDCSLYRGTYDIADFAYVIGADPYSNYYYTYDSSQFPEIGDHSGTNDTRFSDPAMDAALAALGSDVDITRQLADAGALQDAYNAGIPEIPLYFSSAAVGLERPLRRLAWVQPDGGRTKLGNRGLVLQAVVASSSRKRFDPARVGHLALGPGQGQGLQRARLGRVLASEGAVDMGGIEEGLGPGHRPGPGTRHRQRLVDQPARSRDRRARPGPEPAPRASGSG